ncbi:hypothetical protein PR048_032646 [Dryococelus australis]|uniref:NADH:ubiquinone reductase (H(+)-translocating) n=1 Tax=Dryococelus australis TaxID=614101 RepID=A0ABQ9G2S8_9NEOP|nr:hypothetical protein PR048_032646 [Dryococelus australis]
MHLVAGFSLVSPVSPTLAFQRCFIPRFILIGSQDLEHRVPLLRLVRRRSGVPEDLGSNPSRLSLRHTRAAGRQPTLKGTLVRIHCACHSYNATRNVLSCSVQDFSLAVIHTGLVLSGIIIINCRGLFGFHIFIIAHGVCSSGLFCLANIVYERLGSRTVSLLTSYQGEPGLNPRPGHSRIFACGNRAGRCCCSAGFLGDFQFPSPLHSGAAPYSSQSPSSALNTLLFRTEEVRTSGARGQQASAGAAVWRSVAERAGRRRLERAVQRGARLPAARHRPPRGLPADCSSVRPAMPRRADTHAHTRCPHQGEAVDGGSARPPRSHAGAPPPVEELGQRVMEEGRAGVPLPRRPMTGVLLLPPIVYPVLEPLLMSPSPRGPLPGLTERHLAALCAAGPPNGKARRLKRGEGAPPVAGRDRGSDTHLIATLAEWRRPTIRRVEGRGEEEGETKRKKRFEAKKKAQETGSRKTRSREQGRIGCLHPEGAWGWGVSVFCGRRARPGGHRVLVCACARACVRPAPGSVQETRDRQRRQPGAHDGVATSPWMTAEQRRSNRAILACGETTTAAFLIGKSPWRIGGPSRSGRTGRTVSAGQGIGDLYVSRRLNGTKAHKIWEALNSEVLRCENGAAPECKGGNGRQLRKPADTIPNCENPGSTRPAIEPG